MKLFLIFTLMLLSPLVRAEEVKNQTSEKPSVQSPATPEASEEKKKSGLQVFGGISAAERIFAHYNNNALSLAANPFLDLGLRYQHFNGALGFNLGIQYETTQKTHNFDDGLSSTSFPITQHGKLGFYLAEANLLISFGRIYGYLGLNKPIIYEDKEWGKLVSGGGAQIGLGAFFTERLFGEAEFRGIDLDWQPAAAPEGISLHLLAYILRIGYTF